MIRLLRIFAVGLLCIVLAVLLVAGAASGFTALFKALTP